MASSSYPAVHDATFLDETLEFAKDLARKASQMIRDGQSKRWTAKAAEIEQKNNSVDLVTETDQAVEEMIKSSIAKRYPEHKFIGEETYAATGKLELTDEYTWICDPIDGTMNFIHSFPLVGCSIGMTYKKEPVVGVIALPFYDQIFSARRGGGAFMNDTIPLPLTGGIAQPLPSLKECMVSAECDIEGGKMVHGLRTSGASTIGLVQVVTGQMDIYWDIGPHAWDVCAGMVLVQETGGYITGGKEAFEKGDVPIGEIMLNRRYCFVRGLKPREGMTVEAQQTELVKDLYDVVEEWTNVSMEKGEF